MNFKDTETKINEIVTNFNLWLIRHYEDPKAHKEYYMNNVTLLATEEIKDQVERLLKSFVNGLEFPEYSFKPLTADDIQTITNKLKLAKELASNETDYKQARTSILSSYQDYELSELIEWTSDKSLAAEYNSRKSFNESVKKYHQHLQDLCNWSYMQPSAQALGGYNSNYPLLKLTPSYEFYNADNRLKAFMEEFKHEVK